MSGAATQPNIEALTPSNSMFSDACCEGVSVLTGDAMFSTILAGAIIAISFSAPPGPVTMETVRRGLHGGFKSAFNVQLGSIIGDMAWCLVALIGLAPLVQFDFIRITLGVVGVGLLFYLGVTGIRDALKSSETANTEEKDTKTGAFKSGMAISLANPQAVAYWLSAGGALVAGGMVGQSVEQTAGFIGGFLGGTFLWAIIMAVAVRYGRQLLHPVAFRAVTFVCSATLIVFGFTLASQMLSPLL
jgi:chemosensory pili system protein ChpE